MNSTEERLRKRILNVNDAEGARYTVSRMLARGGFEVVEAGTGLAALAALEQTRADLVILDVRLPDIDGLEVCRRIRANPKTASTKVLHTSATFATLAKKVESLEGGADGYLVQPFEQEELIATVQSLLRLSDTERDLRVTAEELRIADRRKDEFLAMLAHELRNPLAAISASIPLMAQREPLNAAEARAREVVKRQMTHLARLIDDLLDVARVTTGKIDLHLQPVELNGLISRVVTSLRQTRTDVRKQSLDLVLPQRSVYVKGDAMRLEQMITNLLDNASKYTDPGGRIQIALDFLADDASALVRLRVRDNGIGISAEALPTIFGLFSQSDVSIARSRGGLGIGLTLVRTLAEMHGGSVTARSPGLGQGSEFEIDLPALLEGPAAAATEAEAGAPRSRGRRLLIVEDNLDAQESLAALCEIWGHKVAVASDGVAGVERALAERPEIALVDIGLPGIDGFEVARRVRAHFGDGITLVALTGYGDAGQRATAASAGFDLHLVKPVDPDRLEELLQQLGETGERAAARA